MGGHLRLPDVLADRDTQAQAAEVDRFGEGPGHEHTLLIEDAVVREVMLESKRCLPVGDEGRGVVNTGSGAPRKRDHQADAACRALAFEFVEGRGRGLEQCGAQHQILRRVADEHEFGEDNQVGTLGGRRIAGPAHECCVAADVSDG